MAAWLGQWLRLSACLEWRPEMKATRSEELSSRAHGQHTTSSSDAELLALAGIAGLFALELLP